MHQSTDNVLPCGKAATFTKTHTHHTPSEIQAFEPGFNIIKRFRNLLKVFVILLEIVPLPLAPVM